MPSPILLVTPPFTQLNTPYPATAYLKGFLNTKKIQSVQCDLGIEVILSIFSKDGFMALFNSNHFITENISANARRILALQQEYIKTIDDVILFLQGKNETLSHRIAQGNFLPHASRFNQVDDLVWAFGTMGTYDKAKHLATLYLEDMSDFIQECVDPNFGFSRYAERLGRSANSFDELHHSLQEELSFIDGISIELLNKKIIELKPTIVAFSVPFPGNLFSAFRAAQWIKNNYPYIKTIMGGGFPNTELRSLSDVRVFDFFDFITLDDGETPIENVLQFIEGSRNIHLLKRTFLLHEEKVYYANGSLQRDYKQHEIGTPDYSDLKLDKYLSVIEILNPMHRLWSDGRWNKLTMAHGCYWGKCTFCDISLDYIKNYEPSTATLICDRIEQLMLQTGETGFHFVDEAAPPALMKALAIEILKRNIVISWWTNIRFEKSFTYDLCYLLKASGCIGVSGGLEVASDRLLEKINKGVTVSQVAKVTRNLSEAGIMVHAYLMYGFPTQTAQETIDSLEMVRQLFAEGVLKSAFWHQFAMTAHSPIGIEPEKFSVKKDQDTIGTFANNDLTFVDTKGTNPDVFSDGLKKSLFNYMHGLGLQEPLQIWFEHKTPQTSIDKKYIEHCLHESELVSSKPSSIVLWLGATPSISYFTKSKKGNQWAMACLLFETKLETLELKLNEAHGKWLFEILMSLSIFNQKHITLAMLKSNFESNVIDEDFELFWHNKVLNSLHKKGLVIV